jgi:hypothetical protein
MKQEFNKDIEILKNNQKDLFNESYKSLKKEIKEDIRRWKDPPCSWIRKINTVKMAILAKSIHMFNAVPIKILTMFFTEIEKLIQINSEQMSNARGVTVPHFQLYYRAIAIKNRMVLTHFVKEIQNIYLKKKAASSTKGLGNLDVHIEKTERISVFHTVTSINSKWTKDFNAWPKTLKQLQDRIVESLEYIGIGNDFLN